MMVHVLQLETVLGNAGEAGTESSQSTARAGIGAGECRR